MVHLTFVEMALQAAPRARIIPSRLMTKKIHDGWIISMRSHKRDAHNAGTLLMRIEDCNTGVP